MEKMLNTHTYIANLDGSGFNSSSYVILEDSVMYYTNLIHIHECDTELMWIAFT